jgi:hypothetical protein
MMYLAVVAALMGSDLLITSRETNTACRPGFISIQASSNP